MAHITIVMRYFVCPEAHRFMAAVEHSAGTTKFKAVRLYAHNNPFMLSVSTDIDAPAMPLPVCPTCASVATEEGAARRRGPAAQVGHGEAAAIAIHPTTGEQVFCFEKPDSPMPERYRKEGFQKVQFHHYRDLERFCRNNNLINDLEGDWHQEDGFFEEDLAKREKQRKEQYERYMEEREKVRKSMR